MPFASPRLVERIEDCYFYHSMDLPGHGEVKGEWDLRPGIGNYLGRLDLAGKRVLDIGTASGFLTFHAEAVGATVVSFDLSEDWAWDVVPHHGSPTSEVIDQRRQHMRRINNGYWLSHRALKSRALAVYGTTYDIPATIGSVDVAFYGGLLLHLRDPFLALQSGARLVAETIVVADLASYGPLDRFRRNPAFIPRPQRPDDPYTWWSLPPRFVMDCLAVLGFSTATVSWHRQLFHGRKKWMYTVVAHRGALSKNRRHNTG
jgi:hypothetical protein